MNLTALRPLLRAALIPLGAALVTRGLQLARDEDEQLAQLAAARRAYLAGAGPDPDEDEDLADEPPAPAGLENFRITGNTNPVNRPRTRQRSALIAAGAGLAGLVLGVAAGRLAGRLAAEQLAEPVPFMPDHPWNVIRSLRLTDDSGPGPDEDEDLADEDEDLADEDEDLGLIPEPCRGDCPACRSTSATGAASDPFRCTSCDYVAPAGQPESRRLWLTLHRNGHAAGLPGR